MKIGLGTVQFGLPYGVSNATGMTDEIEVGRILDYAGSRGVRVLDTAAAYGKSEEVLGYRLPAAALFHIVTKTSPFRGNCIDDSAITAIDQRFKSSLENLRRNAVYGLLVHHAGDMLKEGGERLAAWLIEQKVSGKAVKVGVSVYDRDTLDAILQKIDIDMVQLPLNIFDQRFLANGYLAELKAAGIEIHVRSAFLQGLLLMEPSTLPSFFSGIKTHMQQLKNYIHDMGMSPLEAAIGFVSSIDDVDSVVCGVNTLEQLEEIVICADTQVSVESFRQFAITDESILNPSQWRLV